MIATAAAAVDALVAMAEHAAQGEGGQRVGTGVWLIVFAVKPMRRDALVMVARCMAQVRGCDV